VFPIVVKGEAKVRDEEEDIDGGLNQLCGVESSLSPRCREVFGLMGFFWAGTGHCD
jgi:hypothetical protein